MGKILECKASDIKAIYCPKNLKRKLKIGSHKQEAQTGKFPRHVCLQKRGVQLLHKIP